MKRIAARLVPKDLNFFEKFNREKVTENTLKRVNSNELPSYSSDMAPV